MAEDRALAQKLKGDLDSILLKALQQKPEWRYATVELFAEDLQRFLDHRPVRARADFPGYRMVKFIRRNRVSVALGTLVALAIVSGAVVERRQSVISQQRSEDVRKLATSIVFDVDDAVRTLPGSTRARQLIARTGIDYLTGLSSNSTGDWNLKRELAGAWIRIGIVQGGLNSSNLGDSRSALVSFGNARRLLDDIEQHDNKDARTALSRMSLLYETSNVQWTLGQYKEATTSARVGLAIAASPMVADKDKPDLVQCAGLLHLALARLRQVAGDLGEAESEAATGARLLRPAAEAQPENREAQLGLYGVDVCLGSVMASLGRTEEALTSYRHGVQVVEALCRRYPADTLARRTLMFAYGYVGDMLGNPIFHNLGDSAGALKAYGKMAEQAKLLYDSDSADARAVGDYGGALLRLGLVTPRSGSARTNILERSRALLYSAAETSPQNRTVANNITWVETELGHYEAAIAQGEKALSSAPDDWSALRVMELAVRPLAEEQAKNGQRPEALFTLDHSLRWAAKVDSTVPQTLRTVPSIAIAWQTAGSVYAILAGSEIGQQAAEDRAASQAWYGRAVDEWRKIDHDTAFLPEFAAFLRADELAIAGLERKRPIHR